MWALGEPDFPIEYWVNVIAERTTCTLGDIETTAPAPRRWEWPEEIALDSGSLIGWTLDQPDLLGTALAAGSQDVRVPALAPGSLGQTVQTLRAFDGQVALRSSVIYNGIDVSWSSQ